MNQLHEFELIAKCPKCGHTFRIGVTTRSKSEIAEYLRTFRLKKECPACHHEHEYTAKDVKAALLSE
jgi:endogenous inhibitor of DNA gyrase (YacG/DUF329 family)